MNNGADAGPVPPEVDGDIFKIPRPGDEVPGASAHTAEKAAWAAQPETKELVTMNRSNKPVIVLLGALTALDLAAAVLASRVTGTAKPPPPAVVSMLIVAVLTLAAMYGLWRGAPLGPCPWFTSPGASMCSAASSASPTVRASPWM